MFDGIWLTWRISCATAIVNTTAIIRPIKRKTKCHWYLENVSPEIGR